MVLSHAVLLAIASLPAAQAAFYNSANEVPTLEPDFIVVGCERGAYNLALYRSDSSPSWSRRKRRCESTEREFEHHCPRH
jgi:hypothetical protein